MKHLLLSGEVDETMLEKLMDFMNETDGWIDVSLDSIGGESVMGWKISQILNTRKDQICLTVLGYAQSAAFAIFATFQGMKNVAPGSFGMIHQPSTDGASLRGGVLIPSSKAAEQSSAVWAKRSEALANQILTPGEMRKYKKGEEIYISYERMKKLCDFVAYIE